MIKMMHLITYRSGLVYDTIEFLGGTGSNAYVAVDG